MKNYIKAITLLVVILLSVSGCGEKAEQADASSGTAVLPDVVDSTSVEPSQEPEAEGKKTLTLSICWDYYSEETAEKFKKLHPEVDFEITNYSNDFMKYMSQVSTSLMAGNADDILEGFGISFQDPATVKAIADFYPLMQADSEFNEDDYFINVLKALEYDGGLYTFPASFTYYLVVMNNQVPEELAEKYVQYHGITSIDMMDLYKYIPDEAGLYIHDSFSIHDTFINVQDSFINMENRTCDFNNPRFINFLNEAKNVVEQKNMSANSLDDEAQSKKYLFQKKLTNEVYDYFFDFEEELPFGNPIPFTNEKGQIIITPLRNFCISEGCENKELAWEFIKFIANGEDSADNGGYVYLPSLPVNKKLFMNKHKAEIPKMIDSLAEESGRHIKGDAETEAEKVNALMSKFNNMPMCYLGEYMIYEIVTEPLVQFSNGTMTAEQAASELQNKVSLKLME